MNATTYTGFFNYFMCHTKGEHSLVCERTMSNFIDKIVKTQYMSITIMNGIMKVDVL